MSFSSSFYPFVLRPAYQHYLWGGERICHFFQRQKQEGKIAESWELSDRQEGFSFVENGIYRGMSLFELHQKLSEDLTGRISASFPLLIKLIDAKLNLSIQVHPDEKIAEQLEGEPKTEVWVILAKEVGAFVYVGLKEAVTKKKLEQAIETEKLPQLLRRIDVEVGDVIFVPAGTVHAIGAGCLLLEVQQNSNTTYRAFDYGRRDAKGEKRPLHLEETLLATHLEPFLETIQKPICIRDDEKVRWEKLFICQYFCLDQLEVRRKLTCTRAQKSFTYYFVLAGKGKISSIGGGCDLEFGRSYLLPYGLKEWEIENRKDLKILAVYLHPMNSHS